MLVMPRGSDRTELILGGAKSILLVDWPTRTLPEGLARAGYEVITHEGPGQFEYAKYEVNGAEILVSGGLAAPEHADIVHVFRPMDELASIVELSKAMGATTIWFQSGLSEGGDSDPTGCWLAETDSSRARDIVESQGLIYIEQPHILRALATLS